MPKCRSLVQQEYNLRTIKVGETFEVEQPHVVLLSMLGKIEPLEDEPVSKQLVSSGTANYETRDMRARKGKQKYQTKAMRT